MPTRDNHIPAGATFVDEAAWQHVNSVTKAAGSSFYGAMRLLPLARREAMFAIYAFCREVDDIADGDQPTAERRRLLDEWRAEIDLIYDGAPTLPTARALVEAVAHVNHLWHLGAVSRQRRQDGAWTYVRQDHG